MSEISEKPSASCVDVESTTTKDAAARPAVHDVDRAVRPCAESMMNAIPDDLSKVFDTAT